MATSSSPVALVTGASSGIGQACAKLLQQKGYIVYGASRSGRVPEGVEPLIMDVSNAEQSKEKVAELLAAQGRLDVVVHAAGISDAAPLEATPLAQARQVMDTNFFGSLHMVQATGAALRASKGVLVVISSISGSMGIPYFGVYSASKAALESMVESLRMEMARSGVRVVSVAPGDTNTSIESSWVRMPLDQVPDYYKEPYHQTMEGMEASNENSMPPEKVAKVVWSAIQKDKPKVRYYVGSITQIAAPIAKGILPSRWFEKLISSFYKL